MNIIRRILYTPGAAVGLCSTCSWGTVRKGFLFNEAETFCRLIGPSARVRYAVRDCTGYVDRRAEPPSAETRRIGFVTEIRLAEEGGECEEPVERQGGRKESY